MKKKHQFIGNSEFHIFFFSKLLTVRFDHFRQRWDQPVVNVDTLVLPGTCRTVWPGILTVY